MELAYTGHGRSGWAGSRVGRVLEGILSQADHLGRDLGSGMKGLSPSLGDIGKRRRGWERRETLKKEAWGGSERGRNLFVLTEVAQQGLGAPSNRCRESGPRPAVWT